MISIKEFSRIRLQELLPEKQVSWVWSFEYIDRVWFGEQFAFSHALRLFSSPFKTKSIALDLSEISDKQLKVLSQKLGFKIDRSLTAEQCLNEHGTPVNIDEFVNDRKTYDFFMGPGFEVGFTILNTGGLVYLTMDTPDVAYDNRLNEAASR